MLIQRPNLDVQFQLEHGSADFSVGDDIKGTAFIIPRKNISPHQLSIYLEGMIQFLFTVATRNNSSSGKVKIQIDRTENAVPLPPYTACQTFLRIEQPLMLKSSTDSGLLQGGLRHEIPFGFTVPPRIRGSVCQQFCHHQQVQEEHSLLPPSIGQDDMTPSEISVEYNIELSLTRGINRDGMPAVAEWAFPLFIRSPRIEEAPLLVPEDSKHYCLSKEKFVSKSPISFSRIGALLARTAQPAAIQQAKAMVRYLPVGLQFQAISGPHLPQLSSMCVSLNAITTFGEKPEIHLPAAIGSSAWDPYRHSYVQTVSLGTSTPSPLEWEKCHFTEDLDSSTTSIASGIIYSTSVKVPIKLPDGLSLPPIQLLSCFPNILFDGDSPIPHFRAMEPND